MWMSTMEPTDCEETLLVKESLILLVILKGAKKGILVK